MEDNFWNPSVGTPQESVNEYDQSLDNSYKGPSVSSGLSAPSEPVTTSQPQQEQQSDMWMPQGVDMQQQQQMQLPDIPEVGKPGIDYDMGHLEKIGKSLMVGFGDLFGSVGDMIDFMDGVPKTNVMKDVYGVDMNKPVSDAFHNWAESLQAYGDDVPGLYDLQDIEFSSLADVEFWETGVARLLPFALSLVIPGSAIQKGTNLLMKGTKFAKAAKTIAAGGRSIGISSKYANTLNATKLIKTGISTTAAAASQNVIEGAALAGQTLNEAVAQGVDIKVARNAARQVYVDNLASMGADIVQWGLFTGQLRMGGAIVKTLKKAGNKVVSSTGKASGVFGKTAEAGKAIKRMTMVAPIKNGFKAIGMGVANGITDGVVEQFQEVYQDWSVQRRIAEAKGEEFTSYMDFFMADEQRPTRVLSFATSLLMSGVSNTINTAAENRYALNKSMDDKAESHELLDIFNKDLDSGKYTFTKKDGTIVELTAEQASELGKDSAARTMIQNAVVHGEADIIMEYLESQAEHGGITQEQLQMYKDTLGEVQEAVAKYPGQNLNTKQKGKLVANAWLNNVVTKNIESQIELFEQRKQEIQSLVDEGKQSKSWGKKEIAGIEAAKEAALKELKVIKDSSSQQIEQIYKEADALAKKEKFQKEEAPKFYAAAEKEMAGETLTQEELDLVDSNRGYYNQVKAEIQKVNAIDKAAQKVGKRKFSDYGEGKVQKDGSIEFSKVNKDGTTDTIIVSEDGEVTTRNSRTSSIVDEADAINKEEAEKQAQEEEEISEEDAELDEDLAAWEATIEKNNKLSNKQVTPSAKKEANKNGIDLETIQGTGKDGRIVKGDVQNRIEGEKDLGGEQTSLQFSKKEFIKSAKEGAKMVSDNIKEYTAKLFSLETAGKALDYLEKRHKRRKARNAYRFAGGSERVLSSLMTEKAADGLISINAMVDNARDGGQYMGYIAGLSVFIGVDSGDETFFHENFHGFRKLYGHLPEVKEMMEAIVDQPIYERIKMGYQENIILVNPKTKRASTIRQETALKRINRGRPKGQKIATTLAEYAMLKGVAISYDVMQDFYKSSKAVLEQEGYIELPAIQQTNIQDEALTNLAGKYGAENQDMFISDEGARKKYKDAKKSWKEKISKAFTEEESEWTLEEASKDAKGVPTYVKGKSITKKVYVPLTSKEKSAQEKEFQKELDKTPEAKEVDKTNKAFNKAGGEKKLNALENDLRENPSYEAIELEVEDAIDLYMNEYAYKNEDAYLKDMQYYEEKYGSYEKSPEYRKEKREEIKRLIPKIGKGMSVKKYKALRKETEKQLKELEYLRNQANEAGMAYNEMARGAREETIFEEGRFEEKTVPGFDFEAAFAQVGELIAKNEARYGNIKKNSPSTLKIQELKREDFISDVNNIIKRDQVSIKKQAELFYKEDLPKILEEAQNEDADIEAIMSKVRSGIAQSKKYAELRTQIAARILAKYKYNSPDYLEAKAILMNEEKFIAEHIKSYFTSAIDEENKKQIEQKESEIDALTDDIDSETSALLALIRDEHHDMSDKFYKIVRIFTQQEKYLGTNIDLKLSTNKETIMRGLKRLSEEYPTESEFAYAAQQAIQNRGTERNIEKQVVGNFLHFLQTQVDSSGQDIFGAVLLQFRSMTTERGIMIKDGSFALAISTQLQRDINNAFALAIESTYEDNTYKPEGYPYWITTLKQYQEQRYKNAKRIVEDSKSSKYYGQVPPPLSQEQQDVWYAYKSRLDYSRRLANLAFNEFTEAKLLSFINQNLLPEQLKITKEQFNTLVIQNENGDYVSLKNYYSREKIENMFWDSISVEIKEGVDERNSVGGLANFQDRAIRDVFNQVIIGEKDYNFYSKQLADTKGPIQLKSVFQLSSEQINDLKEQYKEKIKERYNQKKWTSALNQENSPHIVKGAHIDSDSTSQDVEAIIEDVSKGKENKEDPNSPYRSFYIKNDKGEIQHVRVKPDYSFKIEELYVQNNRGSVNLYTRKQNEQNVIKSNFRDVQGVAFPVKSLITALMNEASENYMSNLTTPEGNQINKVMRKYFLEYNQDSLMDYARKDKESFLSLFSYGRGKKMITNPIALAMANGDRVEYISLDGSLDDTLDRERLTNVHVTLADINQISNAISQGNDTYYQVVRDYSDKSRRYYARVKVIKNPNKELSNLVKYHNNKTKSIVDRHNDKNDAFDIHLVASSDTIESLEQEGYKIKKTKNKGWFERPKNKDQKSQLNLLGKKAFLLKIGGTEYDLSTMEGHKDMAEDLANELMHRYDEDVDLNADISANYFINKYYLQDLNSSMMEEFDYTEKNKRATGLIANHDSTFHGERVELLIFKDVEVESKNLNHKVQVLGPNGLEEVKLTPALMDSASYVTQETADKIMNKHGDIVDVKGSFKMVGYGRNIDNKKISSFFGQESNSFYAKAHTIVLNETAEGPLKTIYDSLKAREKYYRDNNLYVNNVIAYADSGIKKGSIDSNTDGQRNKLTINEWAEKLKEGDESFNNFFNSFSHDEDNDIYGYDGRFFGIQGELDKDSDTATASKQMLSNIMVFLEHPNVEVRKAAVKVIAAHASALDMQYNTGAARQTREQMLMENVEAESFPTTLKAMLEDGMLSMPAMRDALQKLMTAKIVRSAFKLRTGGTLSLQESDVLYGWKAGKAKDLIQTDDALKPMSVVEMPHSKNYKGKKKSSGRYKTQLAEAAISRHMAEKLGITNEDIGEDGKIKESKRIKFLATRIPAGSNGSTVVLQAVRVSTKPGNTIAVNPSVSAILGSDLDGDMLHLNTIKVGEDISKMDEKRNNLINSIMSLYEMPDIQNSLTKEVEFKSVVKATEAELEDNVGRDVPNDLSILGTYQMFGQTKGNAPMIALIASQNLVYNYISQGNPNLLYEGQPLTIVAQDGRPLSKLDNSIAPDGGGTWYEMCKWLNLILDDGKNNNRARFQFTKSTGSTFVMLLKMGVKPEKISSFIRKSGWTDRKEFIFFSEKENRETLQKELEQELRKRLTKAQAKKLKGAGYKKLITAVFSKGGNLEFNLDTKDPVELKAMFFMFQDMNDDVFKMSHFLSLDKSYSSEPITAMEAHHNALTALKNQTGTTQQVEAGVKGVGNLLAEKNAFFKRAKRIHGQLLNEAFSQDPYYSNGYRTGLLGGMTALGLEDSNGNPSRNGILNSELNTYKGQTKAIGIFIEAQEGKLSDVKDANLRMVKSMNLMRAALHSGFKLEESLINQMYEKSSLKRVHPDFYKYTKEQQYSLITQIVAKGLQEQYQDNQFVQHIDAVANWEFVEVNGKPVRLKVIRFKPNMFKLMNQIDFTDQIRVIQNDFKNLPATVRAFFIANDFVTTGWGTNGNSISPLFDTASASIINNAFEKVKDEKVSSFEGDIKGYATKTEIYKELKEGSADMGTTTNGRRIGVLAYMALYGESYIDKKGLFKVESRTIGTSELNQVHTIEEDNQWKSDIIKKHRKDNNVYIKSNSVAEVNGQPIAFYSGMPEIGMLAVFGGIMSRADVKTSNSPIHVSKPIKAREGLQDRMTEKLPKVANPTAQKHVPKELVKTRVATQYIGDGAPGSSTDRYRAMYEGEGVANTGVYTSEDTVYVSSNGNRRNRVNPVEDGVLQGEYRNVDLAIKAGAKIIMDTKAHLIKTQKYNTGEIALNEYLHYNGYERVGVSGLWVPIQNFNTTEVVIPGVKVKRDALSVEEQYELFNMLKPYIEKQGSKTNKGKNANVMIGLGLRWDYKSNNPNNTALDLGEISGPAYNKNKYAYYEVSIDGKPLGPISNRLKELMTKATGVDATNYDGAIINLYTDDTFISTHQDVDEHKSANKYPVLVVNIGGSGNFSVEGKQQQMLDLKAGDAYIFGEDGVNRDVFHRTFPSKQDGFLPGLTTELDGQTYREGSYRISVTLRRVKALEKGMPVSPTEGQKPINIWFKDKQRPELSNFAKRPFKLHNEIYKSVEQAFQSEKMEFAKSNPENAAIRKEILESKNPYEIQRLGRTFIGFDRKGWDAEKAIIMKEFIKASFEQNPKALKTLLDTGNATLTHTQDKGKWGKLFPKILMEVRDELRTPSSNQSIAPDRDYHKVPIWEFDKNTSYNGIGEEMSLEDYAKRTGLDLENPIDQEIAQERWAEYRESVKEVKALHQELIEQDIEDVSFYNYTDLENKKEKESKKALIERNFGRVRGLFREYNDRLSHDTFVPEDSSQLNLFSKDKPKAEIKIDALAADPLRRWLEFHFGNHIAEYQISQWEYKHGKHFASSAIDAGERDEDISDLNMWLSPGDFGRGKPAIAYINKNMKMTHMKYQRNINLVTKEMNEKLGNLYREKYETGLGAKFASLWMNYSPIATNSIANKLFENIVVKKTGLKKIVSPDGEITYRDISETKLNPELFYQTGPREGKIKKGKNTLYNSLSKAEQEYIDMYHRYTSFYAGLIENKELYGYTKGSTYIPAVTSSKWETLQRRGLFGVYFQSFRGDQDYGDIMITDINPITGEPATLDYFSWKSIYMYRQSDEDSRLLKETKNRGRKSSYNKIERTGSKQTSLERIVGLERIKNKAKQHIKSGRDAMDNPISTGSRVNDMMALESEQAMNRFNHKQSMASAYLATMNLHKALRNYVSLFMFQHGTAYKDGDSYAHLQFDMDDREFKKVSFKDTDVKKPEYRLAFTGFEDKKQEVDAAIANLGSGRYYDSNQKIGTGRNKNAINYLQKVVKRGLINKERGFTFSGVEAESGIVNFFVNWTMYIALGLNVPAAIGNVAIGKYNAYRQMGGGKLARGESRYWGVGQDGLYNDASRLKARKMIEEFGILTYRAEEIAEGVGGSSLSSLIFWPMITAENWIQQASFLGSLSQAQWDAYYINENGDLDVRDESNRISQEELAKLERDVTNVQGRGYSETDSRMIQLYSLSNMLMQFKRWFPTFLRDRFGKEDIDDLGTMRMGAYTASADFMTKLRDDGKMWNIREWNEELKKLPKHKREAVMRYWRGTHGVALTAMMLGMAAMYMDDDEKDTEAYGLLEKLLGDMLLVVNAPKLAYMANVPAMNTFKNVNLAMYHAAMGTEYQRTSKYGAKGDKRFVSNLAQLLPSPLRVPLQHKKSNQRSLR